MGKFDRALTLAGPNTGLTSPLTTTGEATLTHQGGVGHDYDVKSALFLLAVSNMSGEDAFYEGGAQRDDRFRDLVRAATAEDPDWVARLIPWLRATANMRSASIVAAVEYAKSGGPGPRKVVDAACQRPDEPGEALAYCQLRGYKVAGGLQRGIADAAARLYTERAVLRYDTPSHAWRFADVLAVTHPHPTDRRQDVLFSVCVDRRYGRPLESDDADALPTLAANALLRVLPRDEQRAKLIGVGGANLAKAAAVSWEYLSSLGPMDAAAWGAVIPSMGYMALLRNLRNIVEARVPADVLDGVLRRIADHEEVARARQLPFRFLSAYNAVGRTHLNVGAAIEAGLDASLNNVPSLPGWSLILVDRSGSMFQSVSKNTELTYADTAALFGSALATRAGKADLVQFGTLSELVAYSPGQSVLPMVGQFSTMGGTNTAAAVQKWYAGHDRVIIVTDEQSAAWGYDTWGRQHLDANAVLSQMLPARVPLYTWNLVGYRTGHAPQGTANRHAFGGLSDASFGMIPMLESRASGSWPF